MPNLNLERRAAKRRALSEFTVPPLPELPLWVQRKFDLQEWTADMERWRQTLQQNMREALLSVKVEE